MAQLALRFTLLLHCSWQQDSAVNISFHLGISKRRVVPVRWDTSRCHAEDPHKHANHDAIATAKLALTSSPTILSVTSDLSRARALCNLLCVVSSSSLTNYLVPGACVRPPSCSPALRAFTWHLLPWLSRTNMPCRSGTRDCCWQYDSRKDYGIRYQLIANVT